MKVAAKLAIAFVVLAVCAIEIVLGLPPRHFPRHEPEVRVIPVLILRWEEERAPDGTWVRVRDLD